MTPQDFDLVSSLLNGLTVGAVLVFVIVLLLNGRVVPAGTMLSQLKLKDDLIAAIRQEKDCRIADLESRLTEKQTAFDDAIELLATYTRAQEKFAELAATIKGKAENPDGRA